MKKKIDKYNIFFKYLLKIPNINYSTQGKNMEVGLNEYVDSPKSCVSLPTVRSVRNENDAISGFISSSPEEEEIYIYTQPENESIQGLISSSPEEEEIYTYTQPGNESIQGLISSSPEEEEIYMGRYKVYSGHSISPAPDRNSSLHLSDYDYEN